MTQPTATIEIPSRSQILDVFKGLSEQAFESSAQAFRNVDFYDGVLRSLDQGHSILDQVPEAAGMMPDAVYLTVQRLRRLNQVRVEEAWNLPVSYQRCFHTTIKSSLPTNELIPQFHVEYAGIVDHGLATVVVQTFRRVIDVQVQGTDEALEQLWLQMSYAALTAS